MRDIDPKDAYPARWWHTIEGEPPTRIQCDLCPRDCKLHEGQRGACFVRGMYQGKMVLTTYGRSSGFCIDPIEKKPLNHFPPPLPPPPSSMPARASPSPTTTR